MSHNSSRSQRIKSEARQRPDVIWQDQDGQHEELIQFQQSPTVLQSGSQLAQLVAESDQHQLAMRKIVQ